MTAEPEKAKETEAHSPTPDDKLTEKLGDGTDAKRMGGIEPAKRQAEKDYDESAKESGD